MHSLPENCSEVTYTGGRLLAAIATFLDAPTVAYDAAWRDLWTKRLTLPAEQVPALKKNLAQIILASACSGKRDVGPLKEIALRGVSGRSRAFP